LFVRFNKLEKYSGGESALVLKIPHPTLNKCLINRKGIVKYGEQHLHISRKRKRNGLNVDVEEMNRCGNRSKRLKNY
jgi:hypothetical protein